MTEKDQEDLKIMEYIIVQAGGKGTRLQYLTRNRPKALVPVDNLPMLYHLFRKYPDKRFIIIADYRKEVLRRYLSAFPEVKYIVVDAEGTGTCGGVRQATELIPRGQPFLLIWSDLILPEGFLLPESCEGAEEVQKDYIGISETFSCRWSYEDGIFKEEHSLRHGVAGFFLFTEKEKLKNVPECGELVRWMQKEQMRFQEWSLAGTKEFGRLEDYEAQEQMCCRPFNRITVDGEVLTKEPVDAQGRMLAKREYAWYERVAGSRLKALPVIYGKDPLRMEYIRGKNIYEYDLSREEKKEILKKLVTTLQELHQLQHVSADSFSMKEAYFYKTMDRLSRIEDLVPFGRDRKIVVNGKPCRNIYYHKRELEKRLDRLSCEDFCLLHGDCTFSNLMLREDKSPVFIDPRGYFGYTDLYGDVRYDWAKLYYSIVGNYDQFNRKNFRFMAGDSPEEGVTLRIASNGWEDMEAYFFELTGADRQEIRLLHAVIWLSLTTYAWQDYDSVCGAFYNGLYYLEDVW